MSGPILVTYATGKQGSATVRALLKLPNPPIILAATRSAASAGAQKLACLSSNVKLVQGTLDDTPALFTEAQKSADQPIWGVFSIQLAQGMGTSNETDQGKALIDESISRSVKHFVYSSVDRGGDEKSWETPTTIPHFRSKYDIEHHLRDKAANSDMTWTILRPVSFMDNLAPGMQSRVFLAAMKGSLSNKTPMQWIACRDIGILTAKSFAEPQRYHTKAIGLAGDALTVDQLSEAFREATGQALTPTFGFLGTALKLAMKEIRLMLQWFETDGYAVDIPALRKIHPDLLDFKTWIVEDSPFEAKK